MTTTLNQIAEFKEKMNEKIETSLYPLELVPNKKDFVNTIEFRRFMKSFNDLTEKVDTVSSTLMNGFITNNNHIINSKITRTEVEDLLEPKYDNAKAKSLENKVQLASETIKIMEKDMDKLEKTCNRADEMLSKRIEELAMMRQEMTKPMFAAPLLEPVQIIQQIAVVEAPKEPEPIIEEEPSEDSVDQEDIEYNLHSCAGGKKLPNMNTKIGQSILNQMMKILSENMLEEIETSKKATSELNGMKDEILQVH